MKRQRLISELIQILYQADCPMNKYELYSDLSSLEQIGFISTTDINSVLYSNPNHFEKTSNESLEGLPEWIISIRIREKIDNLFNERKNIDVENMLNKVLGSNAFCDHCDNLLSTTKLGKICTNDKCSMNPDPLPEGYVKIPSDIDGEVKSILQIVNYRAGVDTSKKNRRFKLIRLINMNFWVPKYYSNHPYVLSFGPPNSEKRYSKIIRTLEGLNVTLKNIKQEDPLYPTKLNRISDIAFLRKRMSEK